MSFADVGSGGGRGSGGNTGGGRGGGGGPDGFQQASRALAGLVFQMSTQVAGFRALVDALGTAKDTKEMRVKIATERENISRQARDANAKLKTLGREMDSVAPAATAKAVHSRLISDLQGVLKEFQRAQRLCAEKEMQFVPRDTPKKPAKNAAQKGGAGAALGDEQEKASLLEGALTCHREIPDNDDVVHVALSVCVLMRGTTELRKRPLARSLAHSLTHSLTHCRHWTRRSPCYTLLILIHVYMCVYLPTKCACLYHAPSMREQSNNVKSSNRRCSRTRWNTDKPSSRSGTKASKPSKTPLVKSMKSSKISLCSLISRAGRLVRN